MKKIIGLILILVITLGALTSCEGGINNNVSSIASGESEAEKLDVIVTIFPPYDFVRSIAGDKVNLTQLIAPGSQSHTYEPSTTELLKIQNCDLFIYVGGEGDVWVDTLLSSLNTEKVRVLTLMSCVEALTEETVEGMEEEHEEGEESEEGEVEYDEHVWTSPKRAIQIVAEISETLQELDSANAQLYAENTEAYLDSLVELDADYTAAVDEATGDTIIVADRFPFRYLANDYGIKYYAAFKGCSSDTSDPSPATVKNLIDKVNDNNIPVVFYIEFSNEAMANTVLESTGATKALLHSCHNISAEDFAAGATYLSIMRSNLSALRAALSY